LGYLGLLTGITILCHFTGESGGGKSSVDQVFGICKEMLKRRVTSGMGQLDISDAVTLAKALNHKAIKKTVNYAITFMRSGIEEPAVTKSSRDAKLQSHSSREYHYDECGFPTKVDIDEQSYLPVLGTRKSITMEGVWSDTQYPFLKIIPTPMKLDSCNDTSRCVPGPAEIMEATSVMIPRAEKEAGIQQRKITAIAKVTAVKEEEIERQCYWENKAMSHAIQCGVTPMILCSTPGCIRQFCTSGRLGQHEISGKHQSNGNPRTQSSNPTATDNFTIREMAATYLREMTVGTIQLEDVTHYDANVPEGMQGAVGHVVVPTEILFGWARRAQLKHPGFSAKMRDFLKWVFNRGNEKGNSKCSAGAMRHLASLYGKPSDMYGNDKFWQDAILQSGGRRIFSDAEIPEEWQVKQFICQMSTTVKQKQKATAGVQLLAPDDRRDHLRGHLLDIVPTLPGDVNVLVDYILSLAVDLSIIKQMDILKKSGKGGIYNLVHRRQIIVACKLVGRQAPKSLLASGLSVRAEDITEGNEEVEFSAIPVQADEDTTDESYFDLEELQDLFDSEQNIDEIEEES
jgi:hypothetical protein